MEKIVQKAKDQENINYQKVCMQKDLVIQRLRERGCRITKQRLQLLNIILQEDCVSCKDIYYRASKTEPGIGTATVYRLVNLLEEIGAINRKNMYKVTCAEECEKDNVYIIELEDEMIPELSGADWKEVVLEGLKACGYID